VRRRRAHRPPPRRAEPRAGADRGLHDHRQQRHRQVPGGARLPRAAAGPPIPRALGAHRRARRGSGRAASAGAGRARPRSIPRGATPGGPRALPRPLALGGEAPRLGRVRPRSPGRHGRRTLRARRAGLHALDRTQPAIPRPHHAAPPQGGAHWRAGAVQRRGTRRAGAPLHRGGGQRREGRAPGAEVRGGALPRVAHRRAVRRDRHGGRRQGHVGARAPAACRRQGRARCRRARRRRSGTRRAGAYGRRAGFHRLRARRVMRDRPGATPVGRSKEAPVRHPRPAGTNVVLVLIALSAVLLAEGRVDRLDALWRTLRREQVYTLRPSVFFAVLLPGWLTLPALDAAGSVFDPRPLRELVAASIDLDRIRASSTRLLVITSDLARRQTRLFDNRTVSVDALMAATAVPGAFPPVDVEGTLLVDGGLASRAPVLEALEADPSVRRALVLMSYAPDEQGARPSRLRRALEEAFELAMIHQIRRDTELARLKYPAVDVQLLTPSAPLRVRP